MSPIFVDKPFAETEVDQIHRISIFFIANAEIFGFDIPV